MSKEKFTDKRVEAIWEVINAFEEYSDKVTTEASEEFLSLDSCIGKLIFSMKKEGE